MNKIKKMVTSKSIRCCLVILVLLFSTTILIPNCAFAESVGSGATTALDPTFGTPAPPNDAFPQNAEHVFNSTVVMFIIAIIFMIIAAFDSKKFKTTVPIGMILGSAFCVVPEVVDNYLGGVYWSQSHIPSDIMFYLLGREFNWYVAVMWWAFGAILGYILYAALLRKVKTKTLWLVLAVSAISDIVVEEILLNYGGIYTYFGNQPLIMISKFPCWWMFANVSSLFISVAIAYRFRNWLNGWKSIFILFLMPFCYIGGWTLCGMPTIFAINGTFTPLVTQLLGIITCIIAVIQIGMTMYLVLGRNPFAIGEANAASIPVSNSNASSNKN